MRLCNDSDAQPPVASLSVFFWGGVLTTGWIHAPADNLHQSHPAGLVCSQGALTSTEFHTEANYDYVTINGQRFQGTTGPSNVAVAAGSSFTWRSDGSVANSGFTICWAVGA